MTEEGTGTERAPMRPARCRMRAVAEVGLTTATNGVTGDVVAQVQKQPAVAAAAVAGGASGVRIEGVENLRAARAAVSVPIIAILKRDLDESPVRITPYAADVRALAEAGADIIAYDATDRVRPEPAAALVAAIREAGCIAMADSATSEDGRRALAHGAAILGTTLSGYTDETAGQGDGVDTALIAAFADLGVFVMAEGRLNTPDRAAAAMAADIAELHRDLRSDKVTRRKVSTRIAAFAF